MRLIVWDRLPNLWKRIYWHVVSCVRIWLQMADSCHHASESMRGTLPIILRFLQNHQIKIPSITVQNHFGATALRKLFEVHEIQSLDVPALNLRIYHQECKSSSPYSTPIGWKVDVFSTRGLPRRHIGWVEGYRETFLWSEVGLPHQ